MQIVMEIAGPSAIVRKHDDAAAAAVESNNLQSEYNPIIHNLVLRNQWNVHDWNFHGDAN